MAEARVSSAAVEAEREIVITRVVNAPRELVWAAWTDPKQVVKWWGPKGFSTTIRTMDVRPGGVWEHTMHGPDGTDYPNKSQFLEVVKPERIAYTHAGGKSGGPGAHFHSTWTFEDLGGAQTRVAIRMVFETASDREFVAKTFGAVEGGNQTLGRLDEYAQHGANYAEREVVITRVFDAPRELVFRAWVEPEHLTRWFGPKIFTNKGCEVDARVGGEWRIVMCAPWGDEYPCGGEYLEFVRPEKLVFTNIAPNPDGKTRIDGLTHVFFEEQDGKTKLTVKTYGAAMVADAVQNLDGMEAGWSQSLDKLGEAL